MLLRACLSCRRHVAIVAAACPFCRVALEAAATRPTVGAGRLSRAAVFAGTLSATACSGTAPQPAPPVRSAPDAGPNTIAMAAPVDAQPIDSGVPVDAGPADAPANPAPPADAAVQAVAPVGNAKLRGRVLVSGKRTPLPGVTVTLQSATRVARITTTDRAGRYAFDKVIADDYELKVDPDTNGGYGMVQAVIVTLKARQAKTQDVLVVPVPIRAPIPMPYGAPPARHRTV